MFTQPQLLDATEADQRHAYRMAVESLFQQWVSAGQPVTVSAESLNAITSDLARVARWSDGDSEERLTQRTRELVEQVARHVADADARTTGEQSDAAQGQDSTQSSQDPNAEPEPTPATDPSTEPTPTTCTDETHAGLAERVEALSRNLADARAEITDASDHRLTPIWERAHEVADARGYCEVFDELMEELGAPARRVDIDARIAVTVTSTHYVYVSTTVNAGDLSESWRDAIAEAVEDWQIEEEIGSSEPESYDIEDWSVDSYERQ